ncbi:hypothetical protein DRQ33_03520 [bacterium]|nr:MAG: hypothetical protein DRQ33_03520 [bacterium]
MPDFPEDIESRIHELENIVESEPSAEAFSELAELLRTSEKLNKARQICERGLTLFPEDERCLLTYTRILMDSDALESAEETLKVLIDVIGENVSILLLLGQIYDRHNDLSGIHKVAKKLAKEYSDDIRARRFLEYLKSQGYLEGLDIPVEKSAGVSAEGEVVRETEEAKEVRTPLPTPDSEVKTIPRTYSTRKTRKIAPIIPMEDLMHITALLKGVVGVNHVVLLTPDDRTLASKGCPNNMARSLGLLLRSLKRALYVAFNSLNFGDWKKGVMELKDSTVHMMVSKEHWFALVCESKVSLGALRIAVNAIISRHLKL